MVAKVVEENVGAGWQVLSAELEIMSSGGVRHEPRQGEPIAPIRGLLIAAALPAVPEPFAGDRVDHRHTSSRLKRLVELLLGRAPAGFRQKTVRKDAVPADAIGLARDRSEDRGLRVSG